MLVVERDAATPTLPVARERTVGVATIRWCGAAVWAAVGVFMVLRAPSAWWRWRDDAVITLSHARGLVEFGHPTVSASGQRVDGATAPLQMLAAALFYRLGGSGWRRFLDVQVLASFALAGWSAAWLGALTVPTRRLRLHVCAAFVAAMLGFTAWRSAGWFASGMEGGITVALLLCAAAATVATIAEPHRRGWLAGLAFGLAGLTRVELAALVVPALVVAVVALRRRPTVVARLVGTVGVCWGIVHGWRWLTFGTLIPNSAVVQNKSHLNTDAVWWLAVGAALVAAVMLAWHRPRGRHVAAVTVAAGAGLWWWRAFHGGRRGPWGIERSIAMALAGLVIVIAAGWFAGVGRRSTWALLAAVAAVPIAQRMLFGGARLDAERISSMALPMLALGAALVLLIAADTAVVGMPAAPPPETLPSGPPVGLPRTTANTARASAASPATPQRAANAAGAVTAIAVVLATFGVGASYVGSMQDRPRSLCCAIDDYTELLDGAVDIARAHDVAAPIVATPDLGKLSFDKRVVNVDLGYLGDPMLTEIRRRRPDLIADYLTTVAAPDLIEVHGDWACNDYRGWLTSPEFAERFRLRDPVSDGPRTECPYGGARQVYVRVDDADYAAEMRLASTLSTDPLRAAAAVDEAFTACRGGDEVRRCAAVRRAILRSTPALRSAGTFTRVVDAAVAASPSPRLERLLLEAPRRWATDAAPELIELLDAQRRARDA